METIHGSRTCHSFLIVVAFRTSSTPGSGDSQAMCNRFTIRGNASDVAAAMRASLSHEFLWNEEVLPRSVSPSLMLGDGRELVPMQFGSDDPKWPNNNARVEKLDKWPWKDMVTRRCIVPLSKFREPCYWGEPAGKEVHFYSPSDEYLYVASIYSKLPHEPGHWMSFIMRPASNYVMEHGHHRQPFFLHPDGCDEWLSQNNAPAKVLRQHFYEPELAFEVVREMAASWTTRRKAREKDRDEQLAAIEETGLPLGI